MGQCFSKKEQPVLKVPATYIIKKEDDLIQELKDMIDLPEDEELKDIIIKPEFQYHTGYMKSENFGEMTIEDASIFFQNQRKNQPKRVLFS